MNEQLTNVSPLKNGTIVRLTRNRNQYKRGEKYTITTIYDTLRRNYRYRVKESSHSLMLHEWIEDGTIKLVKDVIFI